MLVRQNEHVILVRLSFLKGKELCFRHYHTACVCVCVCVCVRARARACAFVCAFQLRNYCHEPSTTGGQISTVQRYSKWLSGFWQLVIHNTLEIAVCSCTDGSRNSHSFLIWCALCSSYAFLRLERSLLRWRRTAVRKSFVWNELDYRVDVCRITKGAYIEHL